MSWYCRKPWVAAGLCQWPCVWLVPPDPIARGEDKASMANDVPAASKYEGRGTEGSGSAPTDLGSAAGVLALAQKLHEEHVAEGQEARQPLITEGQSRHDQIIAEATARQEELLSASQAKHDALIAEADVLKVEATAEH